MTYEEAIEILQKERDYAQFPKYVKEAIKIAITTIEKQIPKKIIRKSKKASLEDIKCPNCQREIDAMNIVNYCTYCGQALDWSDT